MFKVLKYAKEKWYIIIVIILLLFVQVYCELTLPDYTSDIVDVGIQNQGIEYPIPEKITEESHDILLIFMDEDVKDLIDSFYSKENGIYKLDISKLTDKELDDLKTAMLLPEMMTLMMTSDSEEALDMQKGLSEKMGIPVEGSDLLTVFRNLPKEQLNIILSVMKEQMKGYPDYMLEAAGVSFVKSEYEKIGTDMNKYQMDYLKNMAVKMLLIAVLAMAVSIVVGFMSSRLAAFIAKDVRSKVFYKVMSFSNAEMDRFSTSSLITRCTNDIQQVQMVMTIIFRMVVFAPIMAGGAVLKVIN